MVKALFSKETLSRLKDVAGEITRGYYAVWLIEGNPMREILKSRRRTLGLVTVSLALLFAAGWIRSLFAHDSVGFPLSDSAMIGVLSASNSVIFCSQYRKGLEKKWAATEWATRFDLLNVDGITWFGGFAGFGIARILPCERTSGVESLTLVIPIGLRWDYP